MFLPIYRNDGALERGVSQATLLPSNVTACDGERPHYRKDHSTTAEIEISCVVGRIRVFAQRGGLRCDTNCQRPCQFLATERTVLSGDSLKPASRRNYNAARFDSATATLSPCATLTFRHRGVAQLGRALGSGPRGRWFESSRPDHFGNVQGPRQSRAFCLSGYPDSLPVTAPGSSTRSRVSATRLVVAVLGVALLIASIRQAGWEPILASIRGVGAWIIVVVAPGGGTHGGEGTGVDHLLSRRPRAGLPFRAAFAATAGSGRAWATSRRWACWPASPRKS